MKIRIEIDEQQPEEIVIHCHRQDETVNRLLAAIGQVEGVPRELCLHVGNVEYYVSPDDILFFETDGGKVYAHTRERMLETEHRLFELEQMLPYCFVRASKSAVVNVRPIAALRRELTGNGEISFRNSDKHAYFSRAYYRLLRDKIEEVRFLK